MDYYKRTGQNDQRNVDLGLRAKFRELGDHESSASGLSTEWQLNINSLRVRDFETTSASTIIASHTTSCGGAMRFGQLDVSDRENRLRTVAYATHGAFYVFRVERAEAFVEN